MIRRIGIPAWSTGEGTFGVNKSYLDLIHYMEAEPVLLYPSSPADYTLDLLLLPGGADVDPQRYNQIPWGSTSGSNAHLEYFDKKILPFYVTAKMPIFGICRGHQTLNVFFGGKLKQHLVFHETSVKNRWDYVHIAYSPRDGHYMEVNSLHHQAVPLKGLAPALEVIYMHSSPLDKKAKNPVFRTDDTVEAFKHKTLPIYGVQWHPEEIYDDFTINTLKMLLDSRRDESKTGVAEVATKD